MAVTLGALCDSISSVFNSGMTLTRVQSYDEITEGVNAGDTPLLMVYCESVLADATGETDRGTLLTGATGINVKNIVIHCDFYTSQRGHVGEDVADQVDNMSSAVDVIEGQNQKPYWDNNAVQAFNYRMDRVQFEFAGAIYPGFRVELTLWVY